MTTPPTPPDMDSEHLRRLAVLETKLDYLIEHSANSNTNLAQISKRVDELENHRQWVTGGAAALTLLSGVLIFALRGYVSDMIAIDKAETDYLEEVCADIRRKRAPNTEYPEVCNL